jgi:HSP20 family protein
MVSFNALVPWRNNKSQTPATREDYFDPFVTFRREVDRIFDQFFDATPLRSSNGWQGITPAVDVEETDKEMIVTAELPGVSDKDIEVNLAGDVLTIQGQKKTEREEKQSGSTYTERRFGSFIRSLRLPFEVKDAEVDASFKDGVLTVRLPKPADLQKSVRRIAVKAS